MKRKIAVIAGAGPAGLTAAYELVHRTDIKPIIFEKSSDIGGISKTVCYKGNRIDIGGHRFFSKSDRVMQWWQKIMQIEDPPQKNQDICSPQNENCNINQAVTKTDANSSKSDQVLLVRNRLSRILYLSKLFNYPISLNINTITNLGISRITKIGASYILAQMLPIRHEKSLEDFLINRFGKELYKTFFKDYTEKVWGTTCDKIEPEWGSQRIKGLSISKAVWHALKQMARKEESIAQKNTETSLIEKFLYPKFGPGQMWEEVANIVIAKGGKLILNHDVIGIDAPSNEVKKVIARDLNNNEIKVYDTQYFFSTMPVKDLIMNMNGKVPAKVKKVAKGLQYRDFITIGLLANQLTLKPKTDMESTKNLIPDNWIYIQEKEVKLGRLQIFNNWSPYLINDKSKVWLGLEYFCNENDELWSQPDQELIQFAIGELSKIGIIDPKDVIDAVVIRMPKTYPAYFGAYSRFEEIKCFTDSIKNLFLIGRNGMHRYNNQDHSMLTAMQAVDNIINDVVTKDNIWAVNAEEEYHEES